MNRFVFSALAFAFVLWALPRAEAQAAKPSGQDYLPPPAVDKISLLPFHPRLVFKAAGEGSPGRSYDEVRTLYRSDAEFRRIFDKALLEAERSKNPAHLAVCWVVTEDERFARRAVDLLQSAPISESGSGSYSDVWAFALAWDWLYHHPLLAGEVRDTIATRIGERLSTELSGLDDNGMAVWHGRNQAANGAMVAALAVGDLAGQEGKLQRAAAHYADALHAYDFSEGWPEGPSYWIHNRAAPYAVAADSFLSATGEGQIAGLQIRAVMRKIGLWTLYQYAPDGVFEPYGDAGYSLPLGRLGYWEMSADYSAKLSQDPALMAGADYFRSISPDPYGKRPLHWYVALAYDPSVRPSGNYSRARPELWMREHLPQAMLFGRESLGVAFFRGDWGNPDELYATFKAGDLLAHHDHYDVGHFSIQRGGALAPATGVYSGSSYTSAYRLGYAIQTVASNSLLVLAPGESSTRLHSYGNATWSSLSGGQRVINPTGFDAASVAHYKTLRTSGPHLERAEITAFESKERAFDYISADLTAAYNSTRYAEPGSVAKVRLVTRQFLYLRNEEAYVVHDRVETTNSAFQPKFLLHSLSKPKSEHEQLLHGNGIDDGILESHDRRLMTAHNRGNLTQVVLLPEASRILKIGGPHFRGYVEADGDQTDGFDGVNLDPQKPPSPGESKHAGLWRTEVEPTNPGEEHRFLNVLVPRLRDDSRALPDVARIDAGLDVDAARVGGTLVVFARSATGIDRVTLRESRVDRGLLLDAYRGRRYRVNGQIVQASQEGVLEFTWPRGVESLEIAVAED